MKILLTCLLGLTISLTYAQKLALVKKGKNIGYIDEQGVMVIPATYKKAGSFSDGLAAVNVDGKWGYIDASGNVVIEPQYDKVKGLHSGVAIDAIEKKWK